MIDLNIPLNPAFDGLSFGMKFIIRITSRQGCIALENIFLKSCTASRALQSVQLALMNILPMHNLFFFSFFKRFKTLLFTKFHHNRSMLPTVIV